MERRNGIIRTCFMTTLLTAAAWTISSRAYAAPASGADTFKSKCAACHGADGSGNTALGKRFQLKDLRSSDVQKQSDADLTTIITNGKPPMPAYGKTLSAGDIQGLVAYLRTLAKS